jgi:hypothetical protein
VSKKLIIETNGQRTEIDYGSLSLPEINKRIRSYERKYGMTFSKYNSGFSCDDARPDEMTDVMDWELLSEEKAQRIEAPEKEGVY